MKLSFNRILKPEFDKVLPLIQKLTENKHSDHVLKERFDEMFEQNYECFSVNSDNEIVGIFGIWFMTRHYVGKSCEPDHVYVTEKYRGKGIGKQIFEWIYAYAKGKGCKASELNTYVSNFPSHKFYYNEGYESWGYHMVKKL